MDEANLKEQKNPQLMFSWRAPIRAYKKKSAGVLRFYIALALLLCLIAFFFGDKILVMPIVAVMFLFYVLTITPSTNIENKITRFGIETGGNTYRFDALSHFYFVKKYDYHVLVVVARPPYYSHIYLVVQNKEVMNRLIILLSEHLVYQEHPNKTFIDKCVELLTKLMPEDIGEVTSPPQETRDEHEISQPASL